MFIWSHAGQLSMNACEVDSFTHFDDTFYQAFLDGVIADGSLLFVKRVCSMHAEIKDIAGIK